MVVAMGATATLVESVARGSMEVNVVAGAVRVESRVEGLARCQTSGVAAERVEDVLLVCLCRGCLACRSDGQQSRQL